MLKREGLGPITVSTHLGAVTFDEKGESHDLSDTQQKSLADRVPTYTYVEDKPKAKPQAKSQDKEETKEEAKEEAKPKTTTRKAPARKTTTKSTTAKKEETKKDEDEK